MAAVIRGARIVPGRILLAVATRAPSSPDAPADQDAAVGADGVATAPSGAAPWSADAEPFELDTPVEPDFATLEREFREQLDSERLEVLEQARRDGYAAGLESAEARYAQQCDALGEVVASARDALANGVADTEDVMVEIAFEAVCKIMGDAMVGSDGVVAVVRAILSGMRERERLLVRVSPVDHTLLEEYRAKLLHGDDGKTIELVSDERVVLGGCLVETTGGTLDGRLETQMRRFVETLSSARRMHGEGLS